MVHSIGSVKMAVMARNLSAGRLSQTMTEEAALQKRVSHYIQKQLREADEANLLDEKDMHVFDLKPMTDTLQLVCCNACKKPIKASQYAAHAELCRSLMSSGEFLSDRNRDTVSKRPPKMDRKRSKAAGKVSPTVAQERCEKVDPFDAAVSRFHLMGQDGAMSSVVADTKDDPRRTKSSSTHGNCLTSPNAKDAEATTGTKPLPKRAKLLADMVQCSEGIPTGRDGCNGSSSRSSLTYVPAPLATKTYYSQRNSRLRAALSYMYHEGATGHCTDEASPKVSEGYLMTCEVTSSRILSEEQLVKQAQEKSITHNSLSSPNPNQTVDQSSGVFLSQMGGHQSMNRLPNQLMGNDGFPSQLPDDEMKTRLYSSKPYPLSANPGAPIATIEQPDGTVPVV